MAMNPAKIDTEQRAEGSDAGYGPLFSILGKAAGFDINISPSRKKISRKITPTDLELPAHRRKQEFATIYDRYGKLSDVELQDAAVCRLLCSQSIGRPCYCKTQAARATVKQSMGQPVLATKHRPASAVNQA